MNSSLFIGATGLKGLAEGMNVVTNNIANVNTVGYKQQDMLFSDLIYTEQGGMGGWWGAQEGSYVAMGETGKGLQVDTVRTLFRQGGYEMSNTVTDMSITGKGFFEVTTPGGLTRYTRAGNFRFDENGVLSLPDGSALMGNMVDTEGKKSDITAIQLPPNMTFEAKGTSKMQLAANLGSAADKSSSTTNPYFSLVESWESGLSPALSSNKYNYAQGMRMYDAAGNAQEVTLYVDGTPQLPNGTKVMEFMLGGDGADAATQGDVPLMAGTITFNGKGEIIDMSAFVPTNPATPNDLASWVPAMLEGGVPTFTLNGQKIGFDLGLQAEGGWAQAPASAAEVGNTLENLPSMGNNITRSASATTGFSGSSVQKQYVQDGYAEGLLSSLEINRNGQGIASFSNGQTRTIFEIPVSRFVSEDGLRREGHNLFSYTEDAGKMDRGLAGSENYGNIDAYSLETSNVDIAKEMVNMIVTQRGFQSNSKVITTADAMLQKAIELKRS